MQTLANKEVRQMSDRSDRNECVFPCTQLSESHTGGWNALERICDDAKIKNKELLTATKLRHRASTLYAKNGCTTIRSSILLSAHGP